MNVETKILEELEDGEIVTLEYLKRYTSVPRVLVSRLRCKGHPIYAVRDGKKLIGWIYPEAK